jgi:hypothetical protein
MEDEYQVSSGLLQKCKSDGYALVLCQGTASQLAEKLAVWEGHGFSCCVPRHPLHSVSSRFPINGRRSGQGKWEKAFLFPRLRSNRLFLASVPATGLPTKKCKGCHDTEQLQPCRKGPQNESGL